jgi:excisionase family DNA binding protein
MTDPPITEDGGSVTIRGAPMLGAAYRSALDGIARRRRDGAPTHDLQQLARALRRAHDAAMSPTRHKDASDVVRGACCEHQSACDGWHTTREMAALLGRSQRSVQRWAATGRIGFIRAGRVYLVRQISAPLVGTDERKAVR